MEKCHRCGIEISDSLAAAIREKYKNTREKRVHCRSCFERVHYSSAPDEINTVEA